MLIDFEVENFRSYRERKRFSFVASSITEHPENLVEVADSEVRLLKTAAVYGANGSGKSNLLEAMYFFSDVLQSPMARPGVVVAPVPFILDETSRTRPTRFRASFLVDHSSTLFDYELALGQKGVEEERLTAYPQGRAQEWFSRTGSEFAFKSPNLKGQKKSLVPLTTPGTPFLAVAVAFGHPQLMVPARWLTANLCSRFERFGPQSRRNTSFWLDSANENIGRELYRDADFRAWADIFLRHADFGIQKLGIKVVEQRVQRHRPVASKARSPVTEFVLEEVTEERHRPFFVHDGENGATAEFDLHDESLGTRKLFDMLLPLYRTLRDGRVAVVDELSASIHPTMLRELIRVFHDPTSNPRGDVDTAKDAVRKDVGKIINVAVMSFAVFTKVSLVTKVLDAIKYTQLGVATVDLISRYLGVEQIRIGMAVKNTANLGQAAVMADIWGKFAVLAYVEATAGLWGMTFGKTFQKGDYAVRTYTDLAKKTDFFEPDAMWDENLVAVDAGYLVSAAIA